MSRNFERDGIAGFDEERVPCGRTGQLEWLGNILGPYRAPPKDLDRVLAARVAGRPWFLVLWEPLPPDIPGPVTAKPWCCYFNTVIFYAIDAFGKHIVDADESGRNRRFREHARVDHELNQEDVLTFMGGGEHFVVGSGRVCWRAHGDAPARWWMCHLARRIHADDQTQRARADRAIEIRRTLKAASDAVDAIAGGAPAQRGTRGGGG